MAFTDLVSSFSYLCAGVLLGLLSLYVLSLGIWRLYFSPISHIPGPKLAALTWAYEFYYDIILGGQYTFKIIELHKEYGPIIRINPEEVHIGDPDFYPVLYPGTNRRREKWRFYTKQFGADESALSTIDHNHHKLRRASINPFFSTQSVRRLQPVIEERADALLNRLRWLHKEQTPGTPVDLMYPFSAFTNDVINEYAFARSDHLIEDKAFGKPVTDYLLTGTHYGKWIQHVEIILKFINALPEAISANFVPGWKGFLKMKKDILAQIAEIKATENTEKWQFDVSHPTIFHDMLSSKILPPEEKTVTRLGQEGQIIVQGGTLTTSWTLAIATFHLLNDPSTLRKLRDDLFTALPDPHAVVPLAELEQIPYLRAVVKESLRLSFGTSGRLARVCPDETLTYTDHNGTKYDIKPGVPVSMTPYKTVTDPTIYPDPSGFHPERWIGDGEQRLERYFPVFSAGSRVCLGMALAQAELFLMLSKLFRLWGGEEDQRPGDVGVIRIFETTVRDCEMARDFFIPIPWDGSKGVRATFEVTEKADA